MYQLRQLAARDEIDYLRRHGYADLLDALSDPDNYMSSGKINKSAVSRQLGVCLQTVENRLKRCREILDPETYILA